MICFSSPAFDSDQLVLEARNELLGAEHQRLVGAGAAVEGHAVDLADIVDGDAVAVFRLARLGLVGPRGFGDALDLLVDLGLRNVEHLPGHGDVGKFLDLDRRDDLIGELEFEIRAAGQDLLGFLLVLGHGDLGLHRGLFAAVGDDVARRVRQDLVDDFGHERLAVDLAQMRDRHLAGAEAVDADLGLGVVQPRHQLGFHVAGRNRHLDFALQAGIQRLGNLHSHKPLFPRIRHPVTALCRSACRNVVPEWLVGAGWAENPVGRGRCGSCAPETHLRM